MDQKKPEVAFFLPFIAVIGIYVSAFLTFFATSFYSTASGGQIDTSSVSLRNYIRFFETPAGLAGLKDTIFISALLTIITLILSYPFAYLLSRVRSSFVRRSMLGIVMVTFLSGGITRAYAWMVVLGNNGLINRLLLEVGLDRIPLLYNLTGVLTALVHFLLPFCMLTLMGAFQTIPRNLEEAAASLGSSKIETFWKVMVPLTARGAVGAGILTFSVAISSFLFPLLLGGGKVRMMSNQVYDLIFVSFDIPFAAATAAIFLLVVILSIVILTYGLGMITGSNRREGST